MLYSRLLMIFALGLLAYLVWITMTGPEKVLTTTSAVQQNNTASVQQNNTAAVQQTTVTNRPSTTIAAEHMTNNIAPEPINNFHHFQPKAPVEQFNNMNHEVQAPVYVEQMNNVPQAPVYVEQMNYVPQEQIVYEPDNQQFEQVEQFNNCQESVNNQPTVYNEQATNINYEAFEANVSGVADTVRGAAPFGGKQEVDDGKFATVKYSGLVDANPGDVIQIEGTDLLTAPLVDNMLYTNSIANTNRNASNDLRGDIPLQFNDSYTPFYSSVIYGAPLSQKQMTIGNL